ncbi:MAG: hypothetical protein U5K79_17645 [Cyclobacteriaceae bacterium]|nr:hypothetical protein [Cyclobacteriaceae bacterium]
MPKLFQLNEEIQAALYLDANRSTMGKIVKSDFVLNGTYLYRK